MWLPEWRFRHASEYALMHHAPTDQWFVHNDIDVLCSAQFQDGDTNLSKIYVGTETGLWVKLLLMVSLQIGFQVVVPSAL